MKKTITFALTLTLAVVLCFALASMAQAGPAKKDPIWSIFKDGTTNKVNWKEADNPRFLVYNNDTLGDETDDIVLDQETGLVWMKIPGTTLRTWYQAAYDCINEDGLPSTHRGGVTKFEGWQRIKSTQRTSFQPHRCCWNTTQLLDIHQRCNEPNHRRLSRLLPSPRAWLLIRCGQNNCNQLCVVRSRRIRI